MKKSLCVSSARLLAWQEGGMDGSAKLKAVCWKIWNCTRGLIFLLIELNEQKKEKKSVYTFFFFFKALMVQKAGMNGLANIVHFKVVSSACFSLRTIMNKKQLFLYFFPGGFLCLKRTRKESFIKIFSQLWYCWCQAHRNHESALQKSRDFYLKNNLLKYSCDPFFEPSWLK